MLPIVIVPPSVRLLKVPEIRVAAVLSMIIKRLPVGSMLLPMSTNEIRPPLIVTPLAISLSADI